MILLTLSSAQLTTIAGNFRLSHLKKAGTPMFLICTQNSATYFGFPGKPKW